MWCCGNKVVLQPPSVVYPPLSDNRPRLATRCKITWGDELLSREWLLWMINCTYVSPLAQSLFITPLLSVVYTLSLSVDLELVKHIKQPKLWVTLRDGNYLIFKDAPKIETIKAGLKYIDINVLRRFSAICTVMTLVHISTSDVPLVPIPILIRVPQNTSPILAMRRLSIC